VATCCGIILNKQALAFCDRILSQTIHPSPSPIIGQGGQGACETYRTWRSARWSRPRAVPGRAHWRSPADLARPANAGLPGVATAAPAFLSVIVPAYHAAFPGRRWKRRGHRETTSLVPEHFGRVCVSVRRAAPTGTSEPVSAGTAARRVTCHRRWHYVSTRDKGSGALRGPLSSRPIARRGNVSRVVLRVFHSVHERAQFACRRRQRYAYYYRVRGGRRVAGGAGACTLCMHACCKQSGRPCLGSTCPGHLSLADIPAHCCRSVGNVWIPASGTLKIELKMSRLSNSVSSGSI
jgi:hypothetical protein